MKIIVFLITILISSHHLQSIVKDSQFKLLNNEFDVNYNYGNLECNDLGTTYFISGEGALAYKEVYSFNNGIFEKALDINDLKAIADTINNEINSLYFNEGKLYITAAPHLFVYDNNKISKFTSDLKPNYLRNILDIEVKNNILYLLIDDLEITSFIPPNITAVISHYKIVKIVDNNVEYFDITDNVTPSYQNAPTGFTIDENDIIWFIFDSKQSDGGGLASFDGSKFKVFDIKYYDEENTLFKTNDIKIFDDEFFISFKYNNLRDDESTGFGGFISFDKKNWKFFDREKINDYSAAAINDFIIIDDENIWLAGQTLIHINPKTDEITQYRMNEIFDLSFEFNLINNLDYDESTNKLWFNSYAGVGYIENVKTNVEDDTNNSIISYYPNPVKDVLNINLDSRNLNSDYTVEIYSIDGKLIDKLTDNQSDYSFQYNTKNLITGTYFVVIDTKTKKIAKKFIKE